MQYIQDAVSMGMRITKLRKYRCYTRAECAKAAGISYSTLGKIERGQAVLRMDVLIKICEVIHVAPIDIIAEEDPMEKIKNSHEYNLDEYIRRV